MNWQFKKTDRWQPLTQHDDLGRVTSQMHVTPHIGALGRFYGFNSTEDEEMFAARELEDPEYRSVTSINGLNSWKAAFMDLELTRET